MFELSWEVPRSYYQGLMESSFNIVFGYIQKKTNPKPVASGWVMPVSNVRRAWLFVYMHCSWYRRQKACCSSPADKALLCSCGLQGCVKGPAAFLCEEEMVLLIPQDRARQSVALPWLLPYAMACLLQVRFGVVFVSSRGMQ